MNKSLIKTQIGYKILCTIDGVVFQYYITCKGRTWDAYSQFTGIIYTPETLDKIVDSIKENTERLDNSIGNSGSLLIHPVKVYYVSKPSKFYKRSSHILTCGDITIEFNILNFGVMQMRKRLQENFNKQLSEGVK